MTTVTGRRSDAVDNQWGRGSQADQQSRGQRSDQRGGGTDDAERMARGLGWFSIGLGIAQIAAPNQFSRMIGVSGDEKNRNAMVGIGVREIAAGLGLLMRPHPAGWAWARVGGDMMDLALLGNALNSPNADRNRVAAATAAVLGVTVLDVLTGRDLSRSGDGQRQQGQGRGIAGQMRQGRPVQVRQSITINRSPEEVYGFWRNFQNLPRFMAHLESVEVIDERRSHWRAKGPAGQVVEWDAEIIEDRPHELIAWRSLPNADVPNAGVVRFVRAPGNRGTEVHVEMTYEPPGGQLGKIAAKLLGESPEQQVKDDLRRFKQVLETGEVVHSESSIFRRPHPARPPAESELKEGVLV